MSSERYEEMREKIPLYLNGRLSGEEARELERFIQQYPEATDEMNDFVEIRDCLKDTSEMELPDQEIVFQRVMERVHKEESRYMDERRPLFERIREFLTTPFLPWAVAVAQLLIIVFLVIPPYMETRYSTLTSPASSTDEVHLNIVFNPDARESDIRGLLNSIGGTIVSGPDENGLYVIRVDAGRLDEILKTLRRSKLIRFVQKRI